MQKWQYDRRSNRRTFSKGQGVWLCNPKRKKGRTPKIDVPWEGHYAVEAILGGILGVIQMSRRCKAQVVHVDKLVPVRGPFDGEWVHELPKGNESTFPEQYLDGIPGLFRQPVGAEAP